MRGSDITGSRPLLTHIERYSCPIMHYSHGFLRTELTDLSNCLSLFSSLVFIHQLVSTLQQTPDSVLHHRLTRLPSFHRSFPPFSFSSLSISTFQAFQRSTLHQRPDSVLQRLTKAHGSDTSRHGKNSNYNLITDSDEGLHTYRQTAKTHMRTREVKVSSCSLKFVENRYRLWDL